MGTIASPDGKFVYVTTGRSRMLLIVDTSTNTVVGSVDAGERPWGVAISTDGNTVFTANGPADNVSVIDVTNRAVVKTIPVGRGPWGAILVDLR
jgi:YVTN family beta-propeller protein